MRFWKDLTLEFDIKDALPHLETSVQVPVQVGHEIVEPETEEELLQLHDEVVKRMQEGIARTLVQELAVVAEPEVAKFTPLSKPPTDLVKLIPGKPKTVELSKKQRRAVAACGTATTETKRCS